MRKKKRAPRVFNGSAHAVCRVETRGFGFDDTLGPDLTRIARREDQIAMLKARLPKKAHRPGMSPEATVKALETIMKRERVDRPEAERRLAERRGVELDSIRRARDKAKG